MHAHELGAAWRILDWRVAMPRLGSAGRALLILRAFQPDEIPATSALLPFSLWMHCDPSRYADGERSLFCVRVW